jgi:hypothetical protein
MRVSTTILAFVAAASLTVSPVFAQGHGNSAKPPASVKPTVKPTTSGKPAASTVTRSTGKPATSGKPAASTMTRQTGKPTTSGKPVATTTHSTGKPATSGKPAKSTSGKPAATTTTATTSGSSSTSKHAGSTSTTVSGSTATPLNPIAAKIASKPNLSAKLTGMLPIDPLTGRTMTLDKASLGFKNQGQFIAALHVSQNLGIPFTELKSHMVTVTPGAPGQPATATQTGSLGRAIQASKTTANVTTEVERAETQATADLQSASSTPVSTPKKTTTSGRGR